MLESGIAVLNFHAPYTALSSRVGWHQVGRTIADHKLAMVLAAVLDDEGPDRGVVGQPAAEKFRCIVQPRVTHSGSGGGIAE